MKLFLTIFLVVAATLSSAQDFAGRTVIGEQNAREVVKKTIENNKHESINDTLIKNKEAVIATAEPVLFKTFGKKNIINERPYECYLINGYWYIRGALPKNSRGGVFEIIISSKDGKVIKLIHGQ